jgi:hypothetical protein
MKYEQEVLSRFLLFLFRQKMIFFVVPEVKALDKTKFLITLSHAKPF